MSINDTERVNLIPKNTNSNHKCTNKMNLRQIIFNKCVVNNQS